MSNDINIEDFLAEKRIKFKSNKQAVAWVKRNLKPVSLLKVGPSYLVDKREVEKLYNIYIKQQREISDARAKRAKTLNKKNAKKKPPEQKQI